MELRKIQQILRHSWLSILLIVALGAVGSFGIALLQPRVYESNASGIVIAGGNSDLGSALSGETLAKSKVKSYLDIAHSRSVAQRVIDSTGIKATPEHLVTQIQAVNPVDTALIRITASADSPALAANLAEAWIKAIGAQIEELERTAGKDELGQTIVSFRSLDAAAVPNAPARPNVRLFVVIGAMTGLLVGLGQAFVRAIVDRRVRQAGQIESEIGIAVLATIPFLSSIGGGRLLGEPGDDRSGKHFAVSESFRELRTNLTFIDVDQPPRIITITSALPGEGKSTVAANLARIIGESGTRVILVDADLRRPTVARSFRLPASVGLTDVLVGRASIDDVLQDVDEMGTVQVLAAGTLPPNPSELLGSRAMRDTLRRLGERAMVIVDAPPLLPVTDAAVLSTVTDGLLLVGRCNKTTVDAVDHAVQSIERVNGRTLGFIMNGTALRGGRSQSYKYKYKYKYQYKSHPESTPA